MLRTMKGKALALGGESAILAAAEQASPTAAPVEEEAKESGTMAARINEKWVESTTASWPLVLPGHSVTADTGLLLVSELILKFLVLPKRVGIIHPHPRKSHDLRTICIAAEKQRR